VVQLPVWEAAGTTARRHYLRRWVQSVVVAGSLLVAGTLTSLPAGAAASSGPGSGYWLTASDGGVFAYGGAPFYGSMADFHLAAPIVAIASPSNGTGYWLVGADGGVFAFGNVPFFGSLPALGVTPSAPITAIAPTGDGAGYWLLGADGSLYAFGDAKYVGPVLPDQYTVPPFVGITSQSETSMTAIATVGMLLAVPPIPPIPGAPSSFTPPTPFRNVVGLATRGAWIVFADGAVASEEGPHVPFYGDASNVALRAPIVGMAMTLDLGGYYLAGKDGGVFTYGDAVFAGAPSSLHLAAPIVGIAAS
jgi:hypothetical protein